MIPAQVVPLTIEKPAAGGRMIARAGGNTGRIVLVSGAIPGTNGETWAMVHGALRHGRRGLPGGSSLARFLADHQGQR